MQRLKRESYLIFGLGKGTDAAANTKKLFRFQFGHIRKKKKQKNPKNRIKKKIQKIEKEKSKKQKKKNKNKKFKKKKEKKNQIFCP